MCHPLKGGRHPPPRQLPPTRPVLPLYARIPIHLPSPSNPFRLVYYRFNACSGPFSLCGVVCFLGVVFFSLHPLSLPRVGWQDGRPRRRNTRELLLSCSSLWFPLWLRCADLELLRPMPLAGLSYRSSLHPHPGKLREVRPPSNAAHGPRQDGKKRKKKSRCQGLFMVVVTRVTSPIHLN